MISPAFWFRLALALLTGLVLVLAPIKGVRAHTGVTVANSNSWWCWVVPGLAGHCFPTYEEVEKDPAAIGPKGVPCIGDWPLFSSGLKWRRWDYTNNGSSSSNGCGGGAFKYFQCYEGTYVGGGVAGLTLTYGSECIAAMTPPPGGTNPVTASELLCKALKGGPVMQGDLSLPAPEKLCWEMTKADGKYHCEVETPPGVSVCVTDPDNPGKSRCQYEFSGNECDPLQDIVEGTDEFEDCVALDGMIVCEMDRGDGCFRVNGRRVCSSEIAAGACVMTSGQVVCADDAEAPPAPDDGTCGVKAAPDASIHLTDHGTTRQIDLYNGTTISSSCAPPQGEDATGEGDKDQNGGSVLCDEYPNIMACQPKSILVGGETCLAPPSCAGGDPVLCRLLHHAWQDRCEGRMINKGNVCGTRPVCSDEFTAECQTLHRLYDIRCEAGGGTAGTSTGGTTCDTAPTCTGDAVQCQLVNQQWRTRCEMLGSPTSTQALLDAKGDQSPGTLVQETVDLENALSATEVWSNTCPADPEFGPYNMLGETHGPWVLDGQIFCDTATAMRPFVLAMAWILAAFTVLGTRGGSS